MNNELMPKTKLLISPLRYPGSKRRLVNLIIDALKVNNLHPTLFVEPFVGGGSVAINLLNHNLADQVIIADLDPWITSFWQVVFNDTQWLLSQIQTIEVSLDQWHEFKNFNPKKVRDQALTCFFLNRTSFSGILEERAGPIGGRNQQSDYPIDCRFTETTRETIVGRILQIAQFRDRVYGVWNLPWEEAIQRVRSEQAKNKLPRTDLFFYLDPPFFEEADALYRFYFEDEDHQTLRNFLLTLEDKWLLSYDSVEQVDVLYGEAIRKGTNGTQQNHIEMVYSIAGVSKRKKRKEVILSNLETLPDPQLSRSNHNNGDMDDDESNS